MRTVELSIFFFFSLSFSICFQVFSQEDTKEKFKREGDEQYRRLNYRSAITSYTKALALSREDRYLIKKRGDAYLNSSIYDSAFAAYNKVIQLSQTCDSICISAKVWKGMTYEDVDKMDSARVLYFEVLKIQPSDFANLCCLGSMYAYSNNYDSCMFFLNKAHEADTNNYGPVVNMVFYSNEMGKYEEAIYYAQKYSHLFVDSTWIGVNLNNMAYAKIQLGNLEEGLNLIIRSLLLYPKNSFAFRNRALYYIAKKKYKKACEDLHKSKSMGGYHITKTLIETYCKD